MGNGANPAPRRALSLLAWVNVAVHLLGLALAAVGMRPGTALAPLPERLAYLASYPLGWSLGWSVWALCSVGLITFLAVLARQIEERAGLAQLAVVLAVTAGAFDLFCDSVYLTVFPWVASWQPLAENSFLLLEKITAIVSLVIANGLYSVSILLMIVALRGRAGLVPGTVAIGYGVFGFGLLLAAAGFTGSAWHAALATVPTIGLFCVWAVLVARSFPLARSRP